MMVIEPNKDFKPGDIILKNGKPSYIVADPVRTIFGKLRIRSLKSGEPSDYVQSTWWKHPDTGYTLPKGYSLK